MSVFSARNHQRNFWTMDAELTALFAHLERMRIGVSTERSTQRTRAQRRPSGVELAGADAVKNIKQYYRETKTKSLRCRVCHYHGRRHIATTFRCPPHHREIIKTSRKITARLINTNTRERS